MNEASPVSDAQADVAKKTPPWWGLDLAVRPEAA